jgi:hemolysin III
MSRDFDQDRGEEIVNGASHALGAALSVAGLVLIVVKAVMAGDPWSIVSVAIFGASMVLLYSASSIYHFTESPGLKLACQRMDHSAIYLLIAGTYTPFSLVTIRGGWGWTIFGIVWAAAIAGIVVQNVFPGRFRTLMTALYVVMGWVVVIAIEPIVRLLPFPGLMWLFAGGLFYTGGVYFYIKKRFRFSHGVWHLFVLAGTVSHYIAIYCYVVP